ncbi:hypothetical protein COY23_02640 [bacterium (Candidatus Torokbacteria) CG_4_10_14_0_2_um_filter_35_8]|nr:MAG: hypothetical protein COY23_02640 [bacterium (Candidatus Torokbacteria) CG_4_10_14_0_2_um_filter_35_8]
MQRKSKVIYIGSILIVSTLAVVAAFLYDTKTSGELAGISDRISDVSAALKIKPYFEAKDTEKTFLVLFQNDMELRPGGGFIGSFAIVTVKDGQATRADVYNSYITDNLFEGKKKPPYPLCEWSNVKNWEIRDSNFSPDFSINAKQALAFYDEMASKNPSWKESFDGVIAINTQTLKTILEFTGPIKLEKYAITFASKNAADELEKWVEKDYQKTIKDETKRKDLMKDLSSQLIKKVQSLTKKDKARLTNELFNHLDNKDILLFTFDEKIQSLIEEKDWGGRVVESGNKDYLMIVDASISSLKVDPSIKRGAEYSVDFSSGKPIATLTLTYTNTAKKVDWRTTEKYRSYTRIYVPEGSWLEEIKGNIGEVRFADDLGKKVFGFEVQVPLQKTVKITLKYKLPENITEENYELIIQHQSGADREIKSKVK